MGIGGIGDVGSMAGYSTVGRSSNDDDDDDIEGLEENDDLDQLDSMEDEEDEEDDLLSADDSFQSEDDAVASTMQLDDSANPTSDTYQTQQSADVPAATTEGEATQDGFASLSSQWPPDDSTVPITSDSTSSNDDSTSALNTAQGDFASATQSPTPSTDDVVAMANANNAAAADFANQQPQQNQQLAFHPIDDAKDFISGAVKQTEDDIDSAKKKIGNVVDEVGKFGRWVGSIPGGVSDFIQGHNNPVKHGLNAGSDQETQEQIRKRNQGQAPLS